MFFRKFIRACLRFFCSIYIKKYKPFIIGITGNTGKTSTKEAIYVLFKKKFGRVRKTPKNMNTDIGVPLAILGLEDARRNIFKWVKNLFKALVVVISKKSPSHYLVLELAADKPGEIEYFIKFLPIDIGVITSIGEHPVHLEFFPNRDRLIKEKTWLIKGIKRGGVAILNRDDKDVIKMSLSAPKHVKTLFYGKNKEADLVLGVTKTYLSSSRESYLKLDLIYKKHALGLKLKNVISDGYAYAAAAALACGLSQGISLKEGIEVLERDFFSLPGRMRIIRGFSNSLIIDDTYNASPLSYFNALATLKKLEVVGGRKITVLGDMAELGSDSARIHEKVVGNAFGWADIIVCVGPQMGAAFEKIQQKHSFRGNFYSYQNSKEVAEVFKNTIQPKDLILIKGAQAMRMERIVKAIMRDSQKAKDILVRQEDYWLKKV